MTQQEKYNLTWHTYTDHLREMMRSLVTDTAFADVTLISEDKKYVKAHKNVLSFCSPTFKEIFTLDHSSSVIYLRGVNHSELESILQFIYLGEATFPPDRMNDFFSAGKSLEIKELTNDFEPEDVPTPYFYPGIVARVAKSIRNISSNIAMSHKNERSFQYSPTFAIQ